MWIQMEQYQLLNHKEHFKSLLNQCYKVIDAHITSECLNSQSWFSVLYKANVESAKKIQLCAPKIWIQALVVQMK